MKLRLTFFLILFNIIVYCQLTNGKEKLIEPLMKIDYAEGNSIGLFGVKSEIYAYFTKIKDSFNNEDLKLLSKNSSNSLVFYSCLELIKRNDSEIVTIYQYYKQNPLKMEYTNGCIVSTINMADFIYSQFYSIIKIKDIAEENLRKLSKNQKDYMVWTKILEESKQKINPVMLNTFSKINEIKNY